MRCQIGNYVDHSNSQSDVFVVYFLQNFKPIHDSYCKIQEMLIYHFFWEKFRKRQVSKGSKELFEHRKIGLLSCFTIVSQNANENRTDIELS